MASYNTPTFYDFLTIFVVLRPIRRSLVHAAGARAILLYICGGGGRARGNPNAQCNLGNCFDMGDGVAQDDAEAFRFYKLAADQGHTEAENNLGWMYAHGRGVALDVAEAIRWFERAAAKGDEDAKTLLAELRGL